jgi:hypothetical protein
VARFLEFSKKNLLSILITIFLFLSIPLTVISIKTSKNIKIQAAGATLDGGSYCSGSNAYIHLWWTVTNSDNQFNIVKDGVHITSTYGFTWISQPEVYNQTHNWQVYGLSSYTYSNTKTITTKDCSPPSPPTVDIKANGSNGPITVGYNSAATISWSSTNAGSCSVSPTGWGGISNQGISTGNLTSSKTYTLNCSGAGGTASKSVQINVAAAPNPGRPISGGGSSNKLNKINLKVAVPFLLGNMKVDVLIEKSSNELVLANNKVDYQLDVVSLGLDLNKIYTLTFSGDKILKRKVQFNASSAETNVNAMELTLGDLNSDSAINNQDQLILRDSISKQTLVGDLNSDGVTNSIDWSILNYNLGKTGD